MSWRAFGVSGGNDDKNKNSNSTMRRVTRNPTRKTSRGLGSVTSRLLHLLSVCHSYLTQTQSSAPGKQGRRCMTQYLFWRTGTTMCYYSILFQSVFPSAVCQQWNYFSLSSFKSCLANTRAHSAVGFVLRDGTFGRAVVPQPNWSCLAFCFHWNVVLVSVYPPVHTR